MGTNADPGVYDYSTTAADNDDGAGDVNWQENQNPNTVNNSSRQNMADLRAAYEDLEWIRWGDTTTFVAATQFKISGIDVTSRYLVGRALKIVGSATGTIYRYITISTFSTDTTVTINSGTLQNEALTVYLGAVSNNNSLPLETGTWIPTIQDNSLSDSEGQTYSTQAGYYTKIADTVFVQGNIAVTSLGTLTAGNPANLAGLPFTSASTDNSGNINIQFAQNISITARGSLSGQIPDGVTYVNLWNWDSATGPTRLLISEITANGSMIFGGHYKV